MARVTARKTKTVEDQVDSNHCIQIGMIIVIRSTSINSIRTKLFSCVNLYFGSGKISRLLRPTACLGAATCIYKLHSTTTSVGRLMSPSEHPAPHGTKIHNRWGGNLTR